MPYILDIESSGLHLQDSYPIEIAWMNSEDESDCASYLIRPASYWTFWDEEAESIHNITPGKLVFDGLSLFEVADFVQEALEGEIVLSDAPDFDQMWLDRLFEAALVKSNIKIESVFGKMTFDKRRIFRKEVDRYGRPHRALEDVRSITKAYNYFFSLSEI